MLIIQVYIIERTPQYVHQNMENIYKNIKKDVNILQK